MDSGSQGWRVDGAPSDLALPKLFDRDADVLFASTLINLLSLALPITILQVYDRVIPNQSSASFTWLVIGLLTALVLDAIMRVARSHLMSRSAAKYEHNLGCEAVARILRADIREVDKDAGGTHAERLNALDSLKEFYSGQGPAIFIDLPFAFIFLALIALVGGPLVLVPIFVIIVVGGMAAHLGLKMKEVLDEKTLLDRRRFNFVIELLTGIHTVKSYAMENLMMRRYERLLEGAAPVSYRGTLYSNLSQSLGAVSGEIIIIAVAATGSLLVLSGSLSIGGLAACSLLSGRALQPLMRSLTLWYQFQTVKVARERLGKALELTPERAADAVQVDSVSGDIELRDVAFSYDDDPAARPLFGGIDLQLTPGDTIGISGANGVGKSTLLWLMAGSLKPSSGTVLYDSLDIAALDPVSIRQRVAYLPQNGVLFRGTIMENLTTFRGNEFAAKAINLTKALGLDQFVARLPDGFDTQIDGNAAPNISGGVRQQIAIVRALLDSPKLILFDEANVGLDLEADEKLRNFLEHIRGQVTMVLVSHRPSLLNIAERVFELEPNGLNEAETRHTKPAGTAQNAPQGDKAS